jgi:hypothetical protein
MISLNEKIENIKIVLGETLTKVEELTLKNLEREKPLKLNFTTRVSVKLSELLRKYPVMSYNEAMSLDYNTIEEHFFSYMELVSYINEYCVLPPNKQHFCALMQITNNQYVDLLQGKNDKIVSLMESIEDYIIGETFTVSQAGQVKEKSTMTRLKAKGQGHSLQENKAIDTLVINNKFNIPASEMLKKIENLNNKLLNKS